MNKAFWGRLRQTRQSVAACYIRVWLIDLCIATIVFGISMCAVRTAQLSSNIVFAVFGFWGVVWLGRYAGILVAALFLTAPGPDKRKAVRRLIWLLLLCAFFTLCIIFLEMCLCAGLPEAAVKALGRPALPALCVWYFLWCGDIVRRLWHRF